MRYGICGQQYLDNNGDPLSAGLLYFYETGTTTAKATYSDSDETIANANPVQLDAYGRQGDIFFSGLAKVILKTSAGVQIDVTDPVGESAVSNAFAPWLVTVEYGLGDSVTDSAGAYYISLTSANIGNNPSISPTDWQKVQFVYSYNVNASYNLGDVCLSGTAQYVSLVGTNEANDPATSPSDWKPLDADVWPDLTPKTANFTAVAGRHYLINTIGGTFTMTLPTSPADGDQVGFTDYGGEFGTNSLTVGRAGESILNSATDLECNISYFAGTLMYTTGRGWVFK